MPELLGEDFDVFLNASALRREELAFVREEFGRRCRREPTFPGDFFRCQCPVQLPGADGLAEEVPPEFGLHDADVGSFIFDLRHDRRDNPLTPRSGYKIFSTLEVASEACWETWISNEWKSAFPIITLSRDCSGSILGCRMDL
jgi:hypothetical protein